MSLLNSIGLKDGFLYDMGTHKYLLCRRRSSLHIDSECMSKEFVRAVLNKVLEEAIYDD